MALVLTALRQAKPGMDTVIAIDGSEMPAYRNGRRFVKRGGEEGSASLTPTLPGYEGWSAGFRRS
jgi:hypothetical protein